MRRGLSLLILTLMAFGGLVAFGQNAEPTGQEIAEAYRSKSGEGGTFIPGTRWERRRIKEIRGWKLRFHRVSERRSPGVMMLRYQVVARRNGSCAQYQVSDTIVLPPPNPELKASIVVDPDGVTVCR